MSRHDDFDYLDYQFFEHIVMGDNSKENLFHESDIMECGPRVNGRWWNYKPRELTEEELEELEDWNLKKATIVIIIVAIIITLKLIGFDI